jgi:hypothetical protein
MKHADKVIDLLAAYPGRPFAMRHIIHYVSPRAGRQERIAIKKAVQRVMVALSATGSVAITPPAALGGKAFYTWKSGT